jgi:hypothetical protein
VVVGDLVVVVGVVTVGVVVVLGVVVVGVVVVLVVVVVWVGVVLVVCKGVATGAVLAAAYAMFDALEAVLA